MTNNNQTQIHPTAIIDAGAEIGQGVVVGAFSVIGPDVKIGDGTQISSNVVIEKLTNIGSNCRIMSGAVLGGEPQDWGYKGEPTLLNIGDNNIIREFVTIHRASGEGEETSIGNNNMLMAYCHIGHNCRLGNNITMANSVGVSGHALIEDKVVFGGITGIHQFVRIGKMAMVGGFSKIIQDVPPFSMVDGRPGEVCDINVVGLRRNNISPKVRKAIQQAYKLLYRSKLNLTQALEAISEQLEPSEELKYLVDFVGNIKDGSYGRQLHKRKR